MMELLGTVSITAFGYDNEKLINCIKNQCKVISLYTDLEQIHITVRYHDQKRILKLIEECRFQVIDKCEKGIAFTILRRLKRCGLLVGIVIALFLCLFVSNIALKINVYGTEDEVIKSEIIELLESNRVSVGEYIPKMDFVNANIKLMKLCDDISWSSIARTGSVIRVDVAMITPKEETEDKRIPSNIIAKRDGVITRAEALTGELEVLVGDAVAKGDLLISGIVERRNGIAYYYHSYGNIIAEFEESESFYQPYVSSKRYYGKTYIKRFLRLFDADIKLFKSKPIVCSFDESSDTKNFSLFDIDFPIGITTKKYTEVFFEESILSTEEAFMMAYKKLDTYERNLLSDYEILSRKITEYMDENGVGLEVTYKLRGEIGEQQEIYAK